MTTLIIARHGNTFEAGETPRRVGARTDIPLVEKGRDQAAAMGLYLKEHDLLPDEVYSSALIRTKETAGIALQTAGLIKNVTPLNIFNEIDYGPDENKTEDEVIARIGEQAIKDWDENAILPAGWNADPHTIEGHWRSFAKRITGTGVPYKKVMVVTSNGTARFAPYLAGNYEEFSQNHKIKLATGAIGIMEFGGTKWRIRDWNIRP